MQLYWTHLSQSDILYVRPSGKGAHQDSFENAPPGSLERKVWDQLLSKDPGGLIIEKEAYAREVLNRPNAMGKVTFIVDLQTLSFGKFFENGQSALAFMSMFWKTINIAVSELFFQKNLKIIFP